MALLNTLTLDQAFGLGHQAWKCILSNWGYYPAGGGTPINRVYTVSRPIVGAQIANDSDVAECGIQFDAGFTFVEESPYGVDDNNIYIRKGRPYFWRTPSQVSLFATLETEYQDTFQPELGSQATTFGPALANWTAPTLRVWLFLAATPDRLAEPWYPRYGTARQITPLTVAETFDGRCVFPIQHAERVRMEFLFGGLAAGVPCEIRVCGISGQRATLREWPMFSSPVILPPQSAGLNARVHTNIPIKNPSATWLSIYPRIHEVALASSLDFRVWAD